MNTPKPTASIREAIYSKAELPINSYTGFIWEVHTRDYPEDYVEYMEQLGDTYPKKTRKEAQDWHNASPKVVRQALCGQLNFVVRQTLTAIELPTNYEELVSTGHDTLALEWASVIGSAAMMGTQQEDWFAKNETLSRLKNPLADREVLTFFLRLQERNTTRVGGLALPPYDKILAYEPETVPAEV